MQLTRSGRRRTLRRLNSAREREARQVRDGSPVQSSPPPVLPVARNPATGEALIDSYELVQAPSLAAWQVARERAAARAGAAPKLAGIFNPTNNLPHAEAEQ